MRLRMFLIVAMISILCFACSSNEKLQQGKTVVAKVENYKSKRDKLPNSLSEIGITETESGPIYYRKESESKYIVWFGKDLGESMTYDSDTKTWK
jgi:hypothetical protein